MPLSTFVIRLLCALVAGALIGAEREIRHRHGGLTTNTLVAVGACIYILISESIIMTAIQGGGPVNNDNLRVLSQVVTGIGFLGAGVIIKNGVNIQGLSSAATIWCSAGVGCLCGYGMWREAAIALAFVLFINWVLKGIERLFKEKRSKNRIEEENENVDIA